MDIRLVIGCAATSVALISVPVVAAGQQEVAVERHHMIPLVNQNPGDSRLGQRA